MDDIIKREAIEVQFDSQIFLNTEVDSRDDNTSSALKSALKWVAIGVLALGFLWLILSVSKR